MPSTPSGSRPPANRLPSSSWTCTSWWASAQSTPTKIICLSPLHRRSLSLSPEDSSSFLMDQCSRHDIPPAVRGDLTDQQGHDLTLELKAMAPAVLTRWRLGNQPHSFRE